MEELKLIILEKRPFLMQFFASFLFDQILALQNDKFMFYTLRFRQLTHPQVWSISGVIRLKLYLHQKCHCV